ncbi:MAG: hypothetical protein IH908_05580 [Proteobacteria bacterium]|nr:hypothetical protein [Pseudomonadota bacterium]
MAHIKTIHDLVGKEVGVTPWIVIDQEKIDNHARNTGDDSWIHIDPDRAAKETPFGSTIAQGFLLLSVLPDMTKSLTLPTEGVAYSVNYGFDRVRIVQPVNEAVLEVAHDTGAPLLDAQKLFQQRSTDGIVGGDWLVDHVHPSVEGHQLLADALTETLISLGKVDPRPKWQQVKRGRYREHFDSLDNLYFLQGEERSRAVRDWAKGRAERLRAGGE